MCSSKEQLLDSKLQLACRDKGGLVIRHPVSTVQWHWTEQTVVVWRDKNSGSNKKGDSGGGIRSRVWVWWWGDVVTTQQTPDVRRGVTLCLWQPLWCDAMRCGTACLDWLSPMWRGMKPGRQTGVVLVLVSRPKPCFLPVLLVLLVFLLLYLCSSHIDASAHQHPIVLCSINLICPAMLPPTFPFFL